MKKYTYWAIIIHCVIASSCTMSKNTSMEELKSTTQTNTSNWKQIFNDEKLGNLIDSALINNKDIKMAVQEIEIAHTLYKMSNGALWPSLGLSSISNMGNDGFRINADYPSNALALSSWEIDIWGKLRTKKQAARFRFLGSMEGVKLIQTEIISQVAKTYFEIASIKSELKIIKKNIRLQSEALTIVEVQKEAGRATNLAVNQFEAQLLNSQTQQNKAERKLASAENYLAVLLNCPIYKVQDTISSADISENQYQKIRSIPLSSVYHRPDIKEAELSMQAAGMDVQAARLALFPSLKVNIGIGVLTDLKTNLYGIAAGLSAPIFQNYQLKGQIRINEAQRKQAVLSYQHKLLTAYNEVAQSLTKINSLNDELTIKKQQVDILDSAVINSHDLFSYGYANYMEIINTQKSVQDAELDLNTTEKERNIEIISLFRALGGSNLK